MDRLEQAAKIAYWCFGVVGWIYLTLVLRALHRSIK